MLEDIVRVQKKGIVLLPLHANPVRRRLKRRGMDLYQRKALIDNPRLRKVGRQLLHGRLRRLAVRTLHIRELHQQQIFPRRAMRRTIGTLFHHLARVAERVRPKWNHSRPIRDRMLAVRHGEERKRLHLGSRGLPHSPGLSVRNTVTLLTPATAVDCTAITFHTRAGSKPHCAFRNALTVSTLGVVAVKYLGLIAGNGSLGAATAAGAACATPAAACPWAPNVHPAIATKPANQKRFTKSLQNPLRYRSILTAIGKRRPLPNDFFVTFSTGAACCRLYSARSTIFKICRTIPTSSPCSVAIFSADQ